MYEEKNKRSKKYYLTENYDSYIDLESGECEYIDEKGEAVTTVYRISNLSFRFLAYLIEHNGIKISFETLCEYINKYNPYDKISTDELHDNDDQIEPFKKQIRNYYGAILSPKKEDKIQFYKYVKNKGFKLIKDGDYYEVILPKQPSNTINNENEFIFKTQCSEKDILLKTSKVKKLLAERAEALKQTDEKSFGVLPDELEMYFTDEKDRIMDYASLRKTLFSSKDNFVIGGEAGIGKSFLFKKLFFENGKVHTPVLIYVKLNDINTCTKKENYSVIQSLLISYYGKKLWDNLFDLVESIDDETEKPVLLLDGVNEIGYADREALFADSFLNYFKMILSTRSEDGIPDKYAFHRIRVHDVSEAEFQSILRQNGISEDYTYVPRTPLFIKLILTTAKLEQPFGRLLIKDGTVEGILQNYVLCELEKALSSFKMNGKVKKVDVALSVYAIIPYLAYRMTAGNIYSVSNEQIQKILEEVLVPEKGAMFSTPEDVEKYSLSRKLLSGIYSESNLIKQLNISDIGEELVSNKLLFEITNSLIGDKNILLLKNPVNDAEPNVSYSFFHQTIQEYLAQLFIYEVVSTEIISEDILFDGPVKANNFSYIFHMYSREQILNLHRMIQCNDKYLDYRIGILRSIWNREVMGESFSYANLDLSNTKEFIVKNDLLEGIDIFNNATIGPNNYDFNSLFGREDGRATGILYVSQSEKGIKTLSDDGIIRTWHVSNDGISCIDSQRTVFYLKNMTLYPDLYPRNWIEVIERSGQYDVDSQILDRVSKSIIIQGDNFNLVIDHDLLFYFDGFELCEIPDFCKCPDIGRGFLKNGKFCAQNGAGEIILWDEVDRNTLFQWCQYVPREVFRFSVDDEQLVSFGSVSARQSDCFFVTQRGLSLKVYIYENNHIDTKELPDILNTTDTIVNDFLEDCGAFYCVCLCCENGSLICVFIDIPYQVVDVRRFDDIHDCKVTSFFLDGYDEKEANYIYLCSCDLKGIMNISSIFENKEGLLCVKVSELFDFEGSIKKQIIPFWQYYEGFEKVNNASGELKFTIDSKSLPNNPAPREMTINKWHIFNGYLYKYTGEEESERIPANVKTIGKYAFANSKIKYLILSDSVELIEEHAFEKSDITSIHFPQSISAIGDYAFNNCKNLENVVFTSETIHLGKECFSNSGIQSVSFENCMGEIGDGAFSCCEKLHSVELSIKHIGGRAFANCYQLKKAILMGSNNEISLSVFEECIELETLVISDKTKIIYDIYDEKEIYFDQIIFSPVSLLAYDKPVRIMSRQYYDNEVMEQRVYTEICKKDSFNEFKNEIQKKMPISDQTFSTVYYHNHAWAEYMLEKGFDVTVLAQVFYHSICEANNRLIEILLSKIDDIYFIEKCDCFSIYWAIDNMLKKDSDNIEILGLLIKKGLIITGSIVEMVLVNGSKTVREFFLKYLFEINYFSGIQNFMGKIEYLIKISNMGKIIEMGDVDISAWTEHYDDPDVKAYHKFLSENPELIDKIGIRNFLNKTVLMSIKECYMSM